MSVNDSKSISDSKKNSKTNNKNNWVSAVIIDDDDVETPNENIVLPTLANNETDIEPIVKVEKKERKPRKKAVKVTEEKVKEDKPVDKTCLLKKFYHSETNIIEVGADEAGRGSRGDVQAAEAARRVPAAPRRPDHQPLRSRQLE
jgi:hypothetical protein